MVTCDPGDPAFDPIRYWRGPVWVIVNWLVADGLSRNGRLADAASLRAETRELVSVDIVSGTVHDRA